MVVERIEIAGLVLELERPTDPERLLDEEAFENDEFLPYWAELWPSAVGLAHHVAALPLAGRSVLELGCGLGLPSLVAAAGGADVVATDWSPDAIALLAANAARNGLENALTGVAADWRTLSSVSDGRFELVLAADVLYEERNVEPLLAAIVSKLAPDGEALVADPGRRYLPAFLDTARRGLSVDTLVGDWTSGAHLVRLRRCGGLGGAAPT